MIILTICVYIYLFIYLYLFIRIGMRMYVCMHRQPAGVLLVPHLALVHLWAGGSADKPRQEAAAFSSRHLFRFADRDWKAKYKPPAQCKCVELFYTRYYHYCYHSQEVSLMLGLCFEYETFIRGVFCPNLFFLCVCLYVGFFLKNKIIASGPFGPPVVFSDNIEYTINIIIHFHIKLKILGPQNAYSHYQYQYHTIASSSTTTATTTTVIFMLLLSLNDFIDFRCTKIRMASMYLARFYLEVTPKSELDTTHTPGRTHRGKSPIIPRMNVTVRTIFGSLWGWKYTPPCCFTRKRVRADGMHCTECMYVCVYSSI